MSSCFGLIATDDKVSLLLGPNNTPLLKWAGAESAVGELTWFKSKIDVSQRRARQTVTLGLYLSPTLCRCEGLRA